MVLLLTSATTLADDTRRVRVDVEHAPLGELVREFAELTQQNIVLLDADLSDRTISIYAPRPVSVDEAFDLFITALELSGLSVRSSDSFWKIERHR